MTELRRRFIEDLQLQGKSERTQEVYVRAVRLLAEHFNAPPDQLTEEQNRQYFLYVTNVKKWSPSTITQALCAIKILYTITLKRDWQIFDLVQPQNAQKLPDILSHDEVMRLIQAIRLPHYESRIAIRCGSFRRAARGRCRERLPTTRFQRTRCKRSFAWLARKRG